MQTYTVSMCATNASSTPVTLTDARDGRSYTVRYINGNCWMTRNLRFLVGTNNSLSLNSATSNVASTYTESNPLTVPYTDFASPGSYINPQVHDSGNDTSGVWYNFAAASAGTITGNSNTGEQIYDLCPKGWKLPTLDQASSLTGGTNQSSTTYSSVFDPTYDGQYVNGLYSQNGSCRWWTGANYNSNGQARWGLWYEQKGNYLSTNSHDARLHGFRIRCVKQP